MRYRLLKLAATAAAYSTLFFILFFHKLATLLIQHLPESAMRRPAEAILKKLPAETKLVTHLVYDLAVPAVVDVNTQIKTQAARDHELSIMMFEMMDKIPEDQLAGFLLGLQKQNYEGVAAVMAAIQSLYVGVIDSLTDGFVTGVMAQRALPENIKVESGTLND